MNSAMTSKWFPAGNSHGGFHARQAFTLIEIMVVVVIFGIVMSMGVPAIYRAFHKDPLRQMVADIEDACHQARAQAIMGGTPAEIVVRADGISGPNSSARFPEDVGITTVKVSGRIYTPEDLDRIGQICAHFYPNGTCDDVTISLLSSQNEVRSIELEWVTGMTTVSDPSNWR